MPRHCISCRCANPETAVPSAGTASEHNAKGTLNFIDDRIEHLVTQLRELRRQRNLLAPVNRLPPEILLTILVYCRDGGSYPTWITLTHVCSLWYHIALSSALLWNTLDFRYPKLYTEILRRSRGIELHVKQPTPCRPEDVLRLSSLPPSTPIASIDFGVDYRGVRAALEARPGQLSRTRELNIRFLDPPISAGPHLHDILADRYPCLQVIRLRRCFLDWSSALMTTPTRLRVIDIQHHPHKLGSNWPKRSFHDVVKVLQQHPSLTYLHLDRALPPINQASHADTSSQMVSLPNLKYLCIEDWFAELQSLFTQLSIPVPCQMILVLKNMTRDFGDQPAPIAGLISFTKLVLTHARSYRQCSLKISWGMSLQLVCADIDGEHTSHDQGRPSIDCTWEIFGSRQYNSQDPLPFILALEPAICALSVSQLIIHIDGDEWYSDLLPEHCRQVFSGLDVVRALHVIMDIEDLLHILQALADFDADTPRLFPLLHTLEIACFSEITRAQNEEAATLLRRRSGDGVFQTLYIREEDDGETVWDVEWMEDVAPTVVWGPGMLL